MADEINIDLSNYKDKMGQRVPPGRYRVLVEDAEIDTASSGNAMINLWFRVVTKGDYEGSTIVDRLVQTPNSMFRTVGFMQAMGLPTPKKKVRLRLDQVIGKRLDVDVDDGDPYNGRVRSEVRGYLRVQSSGEEPPADLPMTAGEEADAMKAFEPEAGKVPDEVDLDKLDLG